MRGYFEMLLTCLQVFCNVLLPLLTVLGEFVWLFLLKDLQHHFWYKWVLCDIIMCGVGTVAYLVQIERINFEHKEASETYLKLEDKEVKNTHAPEYLDVSADYYALSFCSMMKHYRKKARITQEQKASFFVNVLFIFLIQITLLALAYFNMTQQTTKSGGFWVMVHFDIQVCRMVLSILAHLQSEPELRQALLMWRYVLNHGKAKGSIIDLYNACCGKQHPLPHDPHLLTREVLVEAFKHLKKY
jgi:hypothetical protein